eukprot:Gb_41708 [translate_table: standard]
MWPTTYSRWHCAANCAVPPAMEGQVQKVVVFGCTRGVGLEVTKALLGSGGKYEVHALVRSRERAAKALGGLEVACTFRHLEITRLLGRPPKVSLGRSVYLFSRLSKRLLNCLCPLLNSYFSTCLKRSISLSGFASLPRISKVHKVFNSTTRKS